jgi:ABC-type Na+ efflux pump permease subunit
MSDDSNQPTERVLGRLVRDRQLGRLGRLVLKELREILRDRRTIITLVVMPLLIYPLLAVAFQRFLFTSLASNVAPVYVIGVDSEIDQQMLARQLHAGEASMTEQERSLDSVKLGPESIAVAETAKKLLGGDKETINPEVTIVAYTGMTI